MKREFNLYKSKILNKVFIHLILIEISNKLEMIILFILFIHPMDQKIILKHHLDFH